MLRSQRADHVSASRRSRREHAQEIIIDVGQIDIARRVQRQAIALAQGRAQRCAVVSAVAAHAVAGNGRNNAARNLADHTLAKVEEEDIACRVDGQGGGPVDLSTGCRAVAVAGCSGARDGCDDAGRGGHLADHAVIEVGDIDVARRVGGYAEGVAELRAGRRAAVAAVAFVAITRQSTDGLIGCGDFPDTEVVGVRDIDIARSIHGDAHRDLQFGVRGGTAVAIGSELARAGHGQHVAAGDFADASAVGRDEVTARGRDEEIAGGVRSKTHRSQLSRGSREVVARAPEDAISRHRRDGARRDFAHSVACLIQAVNVALGVGSDVERKD